MRRLRLGALFPAQVFFFALTVWFGLNLCACYAFLHKPCKMHDVINVLSVTTPLTLSVALRPTRVAHVVEPVKLTLPQKQARVNKLLKNFVDTGISIANAEKMLKRYEELNSMWRVENSEFSNFVKAFGNTLSYTTQASLFLLWRRAEFQTLIKLYV